MHILFLHFENFWTTNNRQQDWILLMIKNDKQQVQISCPNLYTPLYTPPNISSHVDRRLLNTNRRLNRVNFFFPIHVPKSKLPTPPKKKKKNRITSVNLISHQPLFLYTKK